MKRALSHTLALISLGFTAFSATPAHAQTTAPGPYYATPSWDQTLPSSTRFIVLSNMSSQAVLDRETGLVWEQSPSTSTFVWSSPADVTLTAAWHCNTLVVGNRKGWRLPTVQELASLIDPSVAFPGPTLPAGHPFTNVQTGVQTARYWSVTTVASNTNLAYSARLDDGLVLSALKTLAFTVWCMRSGQGVDAQ